MKKKILLIAVLFMVTLLTGCGSKEKVVIYTSMEEERNQKLTEMVKKEFPELNVVIQHMATGNSHHPQRLTTLCPRIRNVLMYNQILLLI
mgnify:CR=1 FL=1